MITVKSVILSCVVKAGSPLPRHVQACGKEEVGEQPFRGHLGYGELAQGHAYSGEVYMHDWSTGVGNDNL